MSKQQDIIAGYVPRERRRKVTLADYRRDARRAAAWMAHESRGDVR